MTIFCPPGDSSFKGKSGWLPGLGNGASCKAWITDLIRLMTNSAQEVFSGPCFSNTHTHTYFCLVHNKEMCRNEAGEFAQQNHRLSFRLYTSGRKQGNCFRVRFCNRHPTRKTMEKKSPQMPSKQVLFDGWKALCLLRAQGCCCGLNCTSPKFRPIQPQLPM